MAFSQGMNREIIRSPREIAYIALQRSLKEEAFIEETLQEWNLETKPSSDDFRLSQAIAYGACRMALSLDYIAQELSDNKQLKLKLKEKTLLRTALYQAYFLNRIPLYAITNETVAIARKYCHEYFVKFLNAILRKIATVKPTLPIGSTIHQMSIRYSYPENFIDQLLMHYDATTAENILKVGNGLPITMVRLRKPEVNMQGLSLLEYSQVPMAKLEDSSQISTIIGSPDYYIQNITPATLLSNLSKLIQDPANVLDLCASPGGKLLLAHDFFPSAKLFANDVSENKLQSLRANIEKYNLSVALSCSLGEQFKSNLLYDLIILDVPCSNTGVLNKRPEARWRINPENIKALEKTQLALIKQASSLLSKKGMIWYMTCSILKSENEILLNKACSMFDLKIIKQETILPNEYGWDGGFACALIKIEEITK